MMLTKALVRANEEVIKANLKVISEKMRTGEIPKEKVDMSTFGAPKCTIEGKCGSVHCIGGWLAVEMKNNDIYFPGMSEKFDDRLHNLFYVVVNNTDQYHGEWSNITIQKVRAAIKNFISGKKFPWQGVLSND